MSFKLTRLFLCNILARYSDSLKFERQTRADRPAQGVLETKKKVSRTFSISIAPHASFRSFSLLTNLSFLDDEVIDPSSHNIPR